MAEPTPPPDPAAPPLAVAKAFSVHVFTASGAALALLALIAAVHEAWTLMFLALGVALLIDGVDGTLARRYRVAETLPNWSGDVLDLVVDFTTYVFVPAYALAMGGLMPPWLAIPVSLIVVATGAIYFADRRMKYADNCFRGFPALWNAAAFYLFVLKPAPWLCAILLLVLAVMSFAPIHFIHPVRVQRWRRFNLAMLVLWAVLGLAALVLRLDPGPWVAWPLLAVAVYFFAAGFAGRVTVRSLTKN